MAEMVLRYENAEMLNLHFFMKYTRGLDDAPVDVEADEPEVSNVPDPFQKFVQDAELAATLHLSPGAAAQHVHNFAVEIAPLNASVAAHYRSLAQKAEGQSVGETRRLEKRASDDGTTVLRTEETVYPSGRKVIAEIGYDGACIRSYTVEL